MDHIQNALDSKGESVFNQAENFFDELFLRKAPPLSAQIRDLLVKLAPFLAIFQLIFALLSIVFGSLAILLGLLGTILSIATLSGSSLIGSVLGIAQSIVGLILGLLLLFFLAKSISGLFNRTAAGWRALYRAEMTSLIYTVFSLVMTILTSVVSFNGLGAIAGIGSSIFSLLISIILFGVIFYLLFQIKDKYL